jgi:hypothetical protein
LRTYLVNLTSRRAAKLFIAFFVIGVACTLADFGLPWSPALLVAAYGLLLLYTEKVYVVAHAEMTINSPYFLGFLFFLTSLFATFSQLSLRGGAVDLDFDAMIHKMGGALLATIVGLPFRQLLFAYHPTQADQDFFFRTLEEELRRSATEFKRSQAELVQLVQEFTALRETMFAEEAKASRKYRASLDKAIGLFETAFENYPQTISSALSACADSLEVVRAKSRALSAAAELVEPLQISSLVSHFSTLRDNSSTLANSLSALTGEVNALQTLGSNLPTHIRTQLLAAQSDFDEARRNIRTKLDILDADIKAIDKVLTDFVQLTQAKVTAIQ